MKWQYEKSQLIKQKYTTETLNTKKQKEEQYKKNRNPNKQNNSTKIYNIHLLDQHKNLQSTKQHQQLKEKI